MKFMTSNNLTYMLSTLKTKNDALYAPKDHNHDGRYYTESEINTKVETINKTISTAQTNAQTYADNKIAALVNSAPDDLNTLKELADAIADHQDVYDAYVTKVNTALSGKADASHGTHVNYATIAGKAPGTAAVGTSSKVAREDHVHPVQTSFSGNAGSATKLATSRKLWG